MSTSLKLWAQRSLNKVEGTKLGESCGPIIPDLKEGKAMAIAGAGLIVGSVLIPIPLATILCTIGIAKLYQRWKGKPLGSNLPVKEVSTEGNAASTSSPKSEWDEAVKEAMEALRKLRENGPEPDRLREIHEAGFTRKSQH